MGRRKRDEPREKISVRLDLTGLLKDKLEYLMKKYGASTYKSLLEILIIEKYKEIEKQKHREE